MTAIVEARALRKRFGEVEALAGLDLVAVSGQVTALLGPNGAGKTTFIGAVATLVRPDSGELSVAGIDARSEPGRVRRVIGLAGQSASVEPSMTGRENLEFTARLFGLGRRQARAAASAILEQLELVDAGDRLVRTYSGGMRRRIDLGASLVGSPRLLLLDEPTAGLDPRSRMELWTAIRNLVSDGTDVLLTTQYLEEADQLARQVVIIDHGCAIAAGTPSELKSRVGRDLLEVSPRQPWDLPAVQEVLGLVAAEPARADLETGTASVTVDRGAEQLTEALQLLIERHIAVDDIGLRLPSLDEAFLALTGRHTEPANQENAPTALDAA
ncbi:MAG: type transport system ATP-binding protein [Actinomycetota bacterium]|nr:type transport system ATP-binding protein [Actinomycetota bacterium]